MKIMGTLIHLMLCVSLSPISMEANIGDRMKILQKKGMACKEHANSMFTADQNGIANSENLWQSKINFSYYILILSTWNKQSAQDIFFKLVSTVKTQKFKLMPGLGASLNKKISNVWNISRRDL